MRCVSMRKSSSGRCGAYPPTQASASRARISSSKRSRRSQKLNSCCHWCGLEARCKKERKRMYYTVLLELQIWELVSFFSGSESAEAHHVHHIVTVNLHRGVFRKLKTCLFSLGLLCGLLLFTGGQLLV